MFLDTNNKCANLDHTLVLTLPLVSQKDILDKMNHLYLFITLPLPSLIINQLSLNLTHL